MKFYFNGLGQGEVLNLYLFALCEPSVQLCSNSVGCIGANTVMNHLMFADDTYTCLVQT